jgi:type IV pilus assembly protein PilC
VILLVAACILIGILTTFVIPQFSSVYENIGANLPLITVIVVDVAAGVRSNLYWIGPALIAVGAGFYYWRRTETGRSFLDRQILRLPIVGELVRQMTTAQLSRSLATLLAGGLTLVESFEISLTSVTNHELRRKTEPVAPKIREGKPFTDSLAAAGWMPALAVDMIGVGERSGSLKEMLDEVSGFYDAETEVKLGQLTTFIEPAILVTMGFIVITILLAIYLPLLKMVSSAGSA